MRLPDFDVSRRVSVHLGHALERPRIHAIEAAAAVRALGENSRTRLLHEPWEFAFGLEAAPGTSGTRERVFGETILVDVNPQTRALACHWYLAQLRDRTRIPRVRGGGEC